jgi:hypothetical protein
MGSDGGLGGFEEDVEAQLGADAAAAADAAATEGVAEGELAAGAEAEGEAAAAGDAEGEVAAEGEAEGAAAAAGEAQGEAAAAGEAEGEAAAEGGAEGEAAGAEEEAGAAQGSLNDALEGLGEPNVEPNVEPIGGPMIEPYTGAAHGPADPSSGAWYYASAASPGNGAAAHLTLSAVLGNSDQGGVSPRTLSDLQQQLAAAGIYVDFSGAPNVPSGVHLPEPGTGQSSLQVLPAPSPSSPLEQLTPSQELELNTAIQDAVGAYNPNPVDTGPPLSINEVMAGTDWMSSLGNPENASPGRVTANQPSTINQILSGTYANSVLQMQLSSEGTILGSYVSPTLPYDYLFNPNASSLMDAILLSSHSPNAELLQAQSLQLGASMAPIIGPISTWMNPNSGWFAKAVATAGALPMVSDLAGLGSLSVELDSALAEAGEEAGSNLQHVFAGGAGDRGIAVLDINVSGLTTAEIESSVEAIRDMDLQAGMAGGLARTVVSSRSVADSVAALGRKVLSLGSTEAAGHVPDVAGGGNPLGPIMGLPRSVNSSIGGQWSRYASGFTFDGFSLIDRETGEFLYISHALENPPPPINF